MRGLAAANQPHIQYKPIRGNAVKVCAVLFLTVSLGFSSASDHWVGAETWTLANPTDTRYVDEPVRLEPTLPSKTDVADVIVRADGKEVGWQFEEIEGERRIWVSATIEPGQEIEYSIERGNRAEFLPKVKVVREDDAYVLDNAVIGVKVPAIIDARAKPPGPIIAIRFGDGKWVGASFWKTKRPVKTFTSTVIGDGTVFAKIRLRYEFEGQAGLRGDIPAFAQIDVSLAPGQKHVTIEESHEMDRGDFWEFDCTAGRDARRALCEVFGGAAGKPKNRDNWPADLTPLGWSSEALERRYAESDPRIGDTLMWLVPRWNQHYEDGWMFAASDGRVAVGAIPARAGKWFWPHDNKIEVKAKETADYAGLRCPTWKGRRYWFLFAGPHDDFATVRREIPPKRPGGRTRVTYDVHAEAYACRYAFHSLDKIIHEYITTWPGNPEAAGNEPAFPSRLNPLRIRRGWLAGSHGGVSTKTPLQRLVLAQIILDPDFYGTYWNFWSPENPNFYTDLMRSPMNMIAEFKEHPQFDDLVQLVKERFWEDVYHSATLPGGAGQECPGYFAHALRGHLSMAEKFEESLGFDATGWPQLKEGPDFLYRISQPRPGGERVFHPGGDTHPGSNGPKSVEEYRTGDPKKWKTEEFPGFGVIFRHRAGTDRETYLAFKSGPNRGHFHGDQLSFHWCADASPIAVDHYCSYKPRAGQEHMHNRVAFATDDMPYANMDGYERLIAMRTSDEVDVAVGQVESPRLRYVTQFPPEDWDRDFPQIWPDSPLRYRRTVVQMKTGPHDYFVIRDQHDGVDLKAIYCLHVYGDRCDREGGVIDFDRMRLFVAAPASFEYSRHDWRHDNGGGEATKGVRLAVSGSASEFITVLYPRLSSDANIPKMDAIASGVRIGEDEIVFAGAIDDQVDAPYVTVRRAGKELLALSGKDIDLDRSQGKIGLFVPNTGYPFGPIPDWLIRQRIGKVPPPQ